ncbi:hypothetical protein GIB67_036133 [Kingdonia uniflora]|uniref:MCM OB domain-containing protein n=1 Tax=Kingdonia uniflora TaxID=39325 RepID=A0A7J7N9A1_9MAGN|nr:hypothetical protein GIB67_036133 [Kingdonia uniflora]
MSAAEQLVEFDRLFWCNAIHNEIMKVEHRELVLRMIAQDAIQTKDEEVIIGGAGVGDKIEDSEATEDDDRGRGNNGDMNEEGEDDIYDNVEVPVENFHENKLRMYQDKYYVSSRVTIILHDGNLCDHVDSGVVVFLGQLRLRMIIPFSNLVKEVSNFFDVVPCQLNEFFYEMIIVALRRRYWRRCVGNVAVRIVTEGGSNRNVGGLCYASKFLMEHPTPLHVVAWSGIFDCIQELFSWGADRLYQDTSRLDSHQGTSIMVNKASLRARELETHFGLEASQFGINPLATPKRIHLNRGTQRVRLQEIPDGGTPYTVSLLIHGKLVDTKKPGDRVEVTGVYRAMSIKSRINTENCRISVQGDKGDNDVPYDQDKVILELENPSFFNAYTSSHHVEFILVEEGVLFEEGEGIESWDFKDHQCRSVGQVSSLFRAQPRNKKITCGRVTAGKKNLGKKVNVSTTCVESQSLLLPHKRKRDELKQCTGLADEADKVAAWSPLQGVVDSRLDAIVQKDPASQVDRPRAVMLAQKVTKLEEALLVTKQNKINFQKVVQESQADVDRYAIHLDQLGIKPKTLRHYKIEDEEEDDVEGGEPEPVQGVVDVVIWEEQAIIGYLSLSDMVVNIFTAFVVDVGTENV